MRLSRRDLFKKAAAGLVVAAAAPIIPASAETELTKKFWALDQTMIPKSRWTLGGEPITGPGYNSLLDPAWMDTGHVIYHDPAANKTSKVSAVEIINPDSLRVEVTHESRRWPDSPFLLDTHGVIRVEADGVEYVGDADTIQWSRFTNEQTEVLLFKGYVDRITFDPSGRPLTQEYMDHIAKASGEMSKGQMMRAFRVPRHYWFHHHYRDNNYTVKAHIEGDRVQTMISENHWPGGGELTYP